MSKNIKTIEYETAGEPFDITDLGVSQQDIQAADRLLASVADEDNSRVDYSAMLRRIKAEAMEQGLAAAAAKKPASTAEKRRARTKRILRGVASAAAVFVLGLGVFGVIKAFNGPADDHRGDISADNQPVNEATAIATQALSSTEPANVISVTPAPATDVPSATKDTSPAAPTAQPEPDYTPLPTEFAIRGGVKGYTYIKGFASPDSSEGLIPPAMPEDLTVELYQDEVGYYAYGKTEEGVYRMVMCRLAPVQESDDLPEGVAIYTIKDLGTVAFVWRVNENDLMYVEFEGFDYAEAEELLLSYNIPDIAED